MRHALANVLDEVFAGFFREGFSGEAAGGEASGDNGDGFHSGQALGLTAI